MIDKKSVILSVAKDLLVFFLICPAFAFSHAQTKAAVYHDVGVWDVGYKHLLEFFRRYEIAYTVLDADDIKNGRLKREVADVLFMPGGQSWEYLDSLGVEGGEKIKKFVADGGGYVGLCAGAFYAMSHREGGHTTGPYGIGLIEGVGYDGTSLGTPPFIEGMLDFSVSWKDFPETLKIVLFEGPSFRISRAESTRRNLKVIARFPEIREPAMILFEHGKGKVFLTGPHPEVEEAWENWGSEFHDPESDWPLLYEMVLAVAPAN